MKKIALMLAVIGLCGVALYQARLQAVAARLQVNVKGPKCVSCGQPLNENGECTNPDCKAKK